MCAENRTTCHATDQIPALPRCLGRGAASDCMAPSNTAFFSSKERPFLFDMARRARCRGDSRGSASVLSPGERARRGALLRGGWIHASRTAVEARGASLPLMCNPVVVPLGLRRRECHAFCMLPGAWHIHQRSTSRAGSSGSRGAPGGIATARRRPQVDASERHGGVFPERGASRRDIGSRDTN